MQHVDGPSQAEEYGLKLMAKHDVSTTPRNFDVWHTNLSGRDEKFIAAIDLILSNGQPFTKDQNSVLANQFGSAADSGTATGDYGHLAL